MSFFEESIFTDREWKSITIWTYWEINAADIKNDILVQFQYNISDRDATSVVANWWTVTNSNEMALLSTWTSNSWDAKLISVNDIRYRPWHTALTQFSAIFPQGWVVWYMQVIWPINWANWFAVGYNDDWNFAVFRMKNGVIQENVESADWNWDDISGEDFQALNVFKIQYWFLGSAPIKFLMLKKNSDDYITIHTMRTHWVVTSPHVWNPQLPIEMHVFDKAWTGTTNVTIGSGSWQGWVIWMCDTCGNRPFAYEASKALVWATEQSIVNIRSSATFQWKTNRVRTKLLAYQFHVDSPASITDYWTVIFRLRRVWSIWWTPAWTNIDVNNSVIEYDTAGTFVVTWASSWLINFEWYAWWKSSAAMSIPVDAEQTWLFLDPGGIYSITAEDIDNKSVTVRVSFNWVELF